jgi:hypothetical protein
VAVLLVAELEREPPAERGAAARSHVRQAATEEEERGLEHELEWEQVPQLARALPPAA